MRRRAAAAGAADGKAEPTTTPKRRSNNNAAAATPSPPARRTSPSSSPAALSLTLLLYAGLFVLVRWRFFWTPKPLPFPSPAPPTLPLGPAAFCEGGARRHVDALADPLSAPPRQVSAPGLKDATDLVARECARLQAALDGGPRARARIAWARQRVGPAAFATSFLGYRFTNAYRRLTNVLCLLEPLPPASSSSSAAAPPAVVLMAHHDAPVASPGAGDDASQVAVMLELLRAYAAAALLPPQDGAAAKAAVALPKAPLLFVFNGGEEPLCQAAHGFARRQKTDGLPPLLPPELVLAATNRTPALGAFINLESIGPGGVPIVFQHSGAWTVRAYARASPTPRGSGAAQDAFDLGVVVGETDYSRLSYQKDRKDGGGWLPGLDVAHIADGAAYHTDRDSPERLRSGVLQETGEAVAAAAGAMAAELAGAAAADVADAGGRLGALVRPGAWDVEERQQGNGNNNNNNNNGLPAWRRGEAHRAVFFSVGSAVMVRYGRAAALLLHAVVPPILIAAVASALAARSRSSGLSTVAAVGRAALRAAAALVLAVAAPSCLGALRAWLSGVAIAWYSAHPLLPALIYFPPAAAAMLWASAGAADQHKHPPPLATEMLGAALFNALAAALLTWEGFGCAFIFAAWAYAGALGAALVLALEGAEEERTRARGRGKAAAAPLPSPLNPLTTTPLVLLLAVSLPALIGLEHVVVFSYVLGGRMNLSGAIAGIGAADAAIGAIAGAGVAACTGGVAMPLVCRALGCRGRARSVAGGLVGLAILAAVWASVGPAAPAAAAAGGWPYSPAMPKRLLLSRVHFLEQQGSGQGAAAVRVARSGWAFGGTDPNPVEASVVAAMLPDGPSALGLRRVDPSDDLSLPTRHPLGIVYPIDAMADVALFVEEDGNGGGGGGGDEGRGGRDGKEEEDDEESRGPLPSVRLLSDRVAVAGPGDVFQQHRELEIVATSPAPCWALLNVTVRGAGGGGGGGGGAEEEEEARLLWWSLTPDAAPPASHVRSWPGGGSVREHVVRWTSEEEAGEEEGEGGGGADAATGPRLPLTLRAWPADARVRVELHVAPLVGGPRGAARERMVARLPDWAALTWESTTYIGAWEF